MISCTIHHKELHSHFCGMNGSETHSQIFHEYKIKISEMCDCYMKNYDHIMSLFCTCHETTELWHYVQNCGLDGPSESRLYQKEFTWDFNNGLMKWVPEFTATDLVDVYTTVTVEDLANWSPIGLVAFSGHYLGHKNNPDNPRSSFENLVPIDFSNNVAMYCWMKLNEHLLIMHVETHC